MSDIDPDGVPPQHPSGAGEPVPLPAPVLIAIADVAARLDIDVGEVAVVSHEEVDWPDASIGCPHPGMRYAQVVTNGTLTVLSASGQEFRYHAGGRRQPFLCESASD